MRRIGVLLGVLLCATDAQALFPQRYVACREESESALAAPTKASEQAFVALPKRRAPRLALAPLVIDDVAEYQPLPSRRVAETAVASTVVRVLQESRNDYRCIGIPRGTPGILRVVSAPPGTRYFRQSHPESWRQTNMRVAGAFALKNAIVPLRRELSRPVPERVEPWRQNELWRNRREAALALADLNDVTSAPQILALLKSFERDGFHLWRDTVDALDRLDPAGMEFYAIELMGRALDDAELLRQNSQLFVELLPRLVSRRFDTQALLARLSKVLLRDDLSPGGSAAGGCELLAARVRLGENTLRELFTSELATDLRTQRAVACYSTLMPVVFPGQDAAELPVWLHRQRYDAMLEWLARPGSDRDAQTRQRLLAWLRKRSQDPDVAGDRGDRRFDPEKRAKHLVALAALGDAPARRALAELISDSDDDGTAPWLAAYYALRFQLPDAAKLAEVRLRLGIVRETRRFSRDSWPRRGALRITEHGRVIEELARHGDDRFTLGLLDRSPFNRELTATLVARSLPPGACERVTRAASTADEKAIQDAFWSLSVLGNRCRDAMRTLARDPSASPEARGMAGEFVAMLRDPEFPALARTLAGSDARRPALQRAHIIFRSRE